MPTKPTTRTRRSAPVCDCFQVGGGFVAENPDCPIHGSEGSQHETDSWRARLAELEARVARLERVVVILKPVGNIIL